MANMTVLDWSGYAGTLLYLVSYGLLQIGLIRGTGYIYPAMNLGAASLMLLGLWNNFNGPSALVQIAWISISLFGIARIYWMNSRLNFSDEEMTLISYGLPRMARPTARKLLSRGVWMDATPGTVLTTEGHAVTHLHFMLHGAANVASGGKDIATITRGFIGEMAVMDTAPASATVTVNENSRIFSASGTTLRTLSETDPEFASSMSKHLADSTKQKLIAANARLSAAERDHAPYQ